MPFQTVLNANDPQGHWPNLITADQFTRGNLRYLFHESDAMIGHLRDCGGRLDNWRGPHLQGEFCLVFMAEPSTRTGLSCAQALINLGARVLYVPDARTSSSMAKGETDEMMAQMFAQNHPGLVVVRSSDPDTPWVMSNVFANYPGTNEKKERYSIFANAGSGAHEHPTQALLDAYTIQRLRDGSLDDLNMLVLGDVGLSRTINSLLRLLSNVTSGLKLIIAVPVVDGVKYELPGHVLDRLRDRGVDFRLEEVSTHNETVELARDIEFAYCTRPQVERMGPDLPPDFGRRISEIVRLTPQMLDHGLRAFHPLPLTDEIDPDCIGHPNALFIEQASRGLPTRMALFLTMMRHVEALRQ